jgi:hypothetical protein
MWKILMMNKFIKTWAKILKESNEEDISSVDNLDDEDIVYSLEDISNLIKSGKYVSYFNLNKNVDYIDALQKIFDNYVLIEMDSFNSDEKVKICEIDDLTYELDKEVYGGEYYLADLFDLTGSLDEPEIKPSYEYEDLENKLKKSFFFINKSDLENISNIIKNKNILTTKAFVCDISGKSIITDYNDYEVYTIFTVYIDPKKTGGDFLYIYLDSSISDEINKVVTDLAEKNSKIKDEFFRIIWGIFEAKIYETEYDLIEDKISDAKTPPDDGLSYEERERERYRHLYDDSFYY